MRVAHAAIEPSEVVPTSTYEWFTLGEAGSPAYLPTVTLAAVAAARRNQIRGDPHERIDHTHDLVHQREHQRVLERLRRRCGIVFVAAGLVFSTGAALAQDVEAGESSFRKCAPCHSIGPGAKNKVGPELNGLDGRKAGTVAGFTYSDANKNSSVTWNEAVFEEYIKDPRAKMPGTKMVFAGIKSEKEQNDLWAYMSQFDSSGQTKPK
jgi:cytochrome c